MIIKPKEGYNLLGTDSVEMCCMIALGTRYDALPLGIKGVGVAFIKDNIMKNNISVEELLSCFAEKEMQKRSIKSIFVSATI